MTQQEIEKVYRQIASLMLAQVAQREIARILCVDESRISQIVALPEYERVRDLVAAERLESDQTFNDSWDNTEKKALKVLDDNLKYNKDPEFALKIAAVANRARRRGVASNGIITAPQQGVRTQILLPTTYVTKIENSPGGQINVSQGAVHAVPRQRVDCMMPDQIEDVFSPKDDDLLAGVDIHK